MIDDYNHINANILYIPDNIPGPITDFQSQLISEDLNSTLEIFCKCGSECLIETCDCLKSSGCNNYYNNLRNVNETTVKHCYPVLECNTSCTCSTECGNRVVQKGPTNDLVVKKCFIPSTDTNIKGFGLFTNSFKSKGSFICIYAGEVITRSEAMVRHNQNLLLHTMNYIFCLKEHSDGKITETIIDPGKFGNIGRYINHSCEPNCIIVPVRIDSPIPKLAIFTCKDLEAGSEITFDYGSHNVLENDNVNNTNGIKLEKCLCASNVCRQWLPYELY